ncbi:DNA helicase [Bacillus pseudomycoides]|uniref:AAA family ATPase n=1 Tax=Bacillus pseudomycoides TaxID=64104 RepID=UPI000BFE0E27|nr:AAA family ATPase [Bacillus pseudomycoides]PHB23083.1 DNA helicase [Bacillus pseudomycoides]PHE37612.1 DNA helicase [Bacillus pseudomycoides]
MVSGEMILSKVIETNSITSLKKFNVKREDLQTEVERQAYDFIMEYEARHSHAPDYRTVISMVPEFNFRENVTDSFEYLAMKLKEKQLESKAEQYLTQEALPSWENTPVLEWIQKTTETLETLKQETSYQAKVGTDLVEDYQDFLSEYDNRKAGKSHRTFPSSFPSMRKAIGNYISGNMYTWYARSGRGKSYITTIEGIHMAMEGATLLVWSMEMSKFEWLARAYSIISARLQLVEQKMNGADYLAGFKSNELINGKLDPDHEKNFRDFLASLNDVIKGRIIIRGKTDRDFHDRSVDALESDILQTKADVVIVDPFYLLDYERNNDRTTGGAATATSQKLNRVAGSTDTVIFAITQAEEVRDDKDEDGARSLRVPERSEVKKTTALLEDAFLLIGLDTCDGRFQISLNKGRQGGEDESFEGVYLPAIGYVREPEIEEVKAQFNSFDFGGM